MNPVGANPTGVSISRERREEIYQIARDYDLIIFEDDPYYFLHFDQVQILPNFPLFGFTLLIFVIHNEML